MSIDFLNVGVTLSETHQRQGIVCTHLLRLFLF